MKPVRPRELLNVLRRVLGAKEACYSSAFADDALGVTPSRSWVGVLCAASAVASSSSISAAYPTTADGWIVGIAKHLVEPAENEFQSGWFLELGAKPPSW